MTLENADLIIRLAHELAVALELHCAPEQVPDEWSDALDALRDTRSVLMLSGLAVPPPIDSVLAMARQGRPHHPANDQD